MFIAMLLNMTTVASLSELNAHRLHRSGQRRIGARELLESEPRHLGDHIVDGGLEAGRCRPRDVVLDLVERIAERELRGYLGDREAYGLRRQRGGTRYAWVHLDDDDAARVGLPVAAPSGCRAIKNSPVSGMMRFTGESCFFISVLLSLPGLSALPRFP